MKTGSLLFLAGVLCSLPLAGQQVQFRNTGEAVRYYEELVGTLAQQVRAMQDENAKLAGSLFELQGRIKALEQNYQGMRGEIQTVKQQFEADKSNRAHQFNQLADKLQKAVSVPQQTQSQSTQQTQSQSTQQVPRKTAGETAQAGEYDIYEVQQGDTLFVISRATGVSVSEIRRFNDLKKDTIHPGQKLKIPRGKAK